MRRLKYAYAGSPVAVTATIEDLYQRMHGMSLREMDQIVDSAGTLCQEHELAGFVTGVEVGIELLWWQR